MKIKNILLVILSIATSITSYCYDDLEKGVDLSARTTVTGVLLNQLVDNATVRTNRGLIIATNNAPNVVANPRFKNYIWLDTSFEPPVIKTYSISLGEWITSTLAPNSVVETNIANFAITSVKLNDNSVTTRSISNNAVTVQKIMDAAITTDKILNGNVTREKIANKAINGILIDDKAIIGYTHIADGTITSNQIGALMIDGENIAIRTITSNNIATNTIRWYNIGQNEITTYNITNSAITSDKIANGNVNTNHLSQEIYDRIYNDVSYAKFYHDADSANVTVVYKTGFITNIVYSGTNWDYIVYFNSDLGTTNYHVEITSSFRKEGSWEWTYNGYVDFVTGNSFYIRYRRYEGDKTYRATTPVYVTVTKIPGL